MLKDGKRLDDVGGSQRVEPMGRLSEYVISLPSTVSLDDVASVIIRFRTNNTRRYRAVRMAKIWITSVKPEFKRAQFNVPDDARNELVPDSEFVMHRGCKMFNKEADKLLISMYAGTGFLCQDVKIENAVHEDEQADWQQFFKAPTPVVAA